MTAMKSLWAMVQGDSVFMRRVNGWLTIFWILMTPVSLITHRVNQEVEAKQREREDLAGDVVARMVQGTDVQRESGMHRGHPQPAPGASR